MQQVMVRCPQLNRTVLLKPAEVQAVMGNKLRVRIVGEITTREVLASDTEPVQQVFGQPNMNFRRAVSLPIQCFPTSLRALGNRV